MKKIKILLMLLFIILNQHFLTEKLFSKNFYQNNKPNPANLNKNKLKNPDFENFSGNSGVADFWEFHAGHGATASRSTEAKNGSYCQRIDIGQISPPNAQNYIVMTQSQDYIQLKGNQTYRFSFWAKGKGQIASSIILNGYLYIKWGKITALTEEWKYFEYTFTTPDTIWEICELIRFDDNNNFKGKIESDDWLLIDEACIIGPLAQIDQVRVNPVLGSPGQDIVITAKLSDPDTTIQSVVAEIESPDEILQARLELFDDGLHDDQAPGDKIFGHRWTTLIQPMSYFLDIMIIDLSNDTLKLNNSTLFSTQSASLPVQLTHDSGPDYSADFLETAPGQNWIFWNSYRNSKSTIWYKKSSDFGLNWSEANSINTTMSTYNPNAVQTADGKIWLFYDDFDNIWFIISNDSGKTWSNPRQFISDPAFEWNPKVSADNTGRLAVVWSSMKFGNMDVFYQISLDNGLNWTDAVAITQDKNHDQNPAIAIDRQGGIHLVWGQANSYEIAYIKSNDNGLTWNSPITLTSDFPKSVDYPAVGIDTQGKIWIAFSAREYFEQGGSNYNWDIYYTNSEDGLSWSKKYQLTRFAGSDYCCDLAIIQNQPWIIWESDRSNNSDIWTGILEMTQDISPPPYVNTLSHSPSSPFPLAGDLITITANLSDDKEITRAQLAYSLNSQAIQYNPMYDDGRHNDQSAGDNLFGIQIGPFPAGTMIEYQVKVEDIDGNIFIAPAKPTKIEILSPFVSGSPILLLADYKYNYSSIRKYYTTALDTNAFKYDVWDCYQRGMPPDSVIKNYVNGVIIWFTPYTGYISDKAVQSQLKRYLVSGGKLFISGQNIGAALKDSDFLSTYLHAKFLQDNVGLYALKGFENEPIINGMKLLIAGPNGANNQYSPDEIEPIPPATKILEYTSNAFMANSLNYFWSHSGDNSFPNQYFKQMNLSSFNPEFLPATSDFAPPSNSNSSSGTGAIKVESGKYKVVYFAFGFEGIVEASHRAAIMSSVINWLIPQETAVKSHDREQLPLEFDLLPNYPNPFNPQTTIKYQLPAELEVKLAIYNLRGQHITTLINRKQPAGYYTVTWNGLDDKGQTVASGIYLYQISTEKFTKQRKLILLR